MYVLTCDIGTTGNKTSLYRIGEKLELIQASQAGYPIYTTPDGGVEQRVDEWWSAIGEAVGFILAKTKLDPGEIKGLAFCCQMQGSVVVDKNGQALRNPMIYLDGRATKQIEEQLHHGLLRISNCSALKLLKSLYITGGLAATAKDPLWKYHWVRENEPDIFRHVHKWLDVKDYLILRCTGQYGMTQDSANVTFLYNTRPKKHGWHPGLCRTFGVDMDHLPPVVASTDVVGTLTEKAASDLGLVAGIPVFGGGGDVSCIALGAGCTSLYDTHIYIGTSGWVVSNVNQRLVDINNFMASILGSIPAHYNYIAEQETSGLCLQWVRDHLARDEIGVYLKRHEADKEEDLDLLYGLLTETVQETPAGAGKVIFTPWLHGNRAPREDPYARAMFFNIGLDTGKRMLVRAVLEGVAYHKRWMLEAMERKIPFQEKVRFVGGGAKSEVWCQIMADVTNRAIETIENPQDAGAAGAAMICGVGLGLFSSFQSVKTLVSGARSYLPQREYRQDYDQGFAIFKELYHRNKKLFRQFNR